MIAVNREKFILNFAVAKKDACCFAFTRVSDFVLVSSGDKKLAPGINDKGRSVHHDLEHACDHIKGLRIHILKILVRAFPSSYLVCVPLS